jgi:RHS repeat-associated protein
VLTGPPVAALTGSRTFGPWGAVTASGGTLAGSLGYQSQYTSPATGQVDMGARWYNTGTGSFGNKDTVSNKTVPDSASASPFGYAADNPLDLTDPSGHTALDAHQLHLLHVAHVAAVAHAAHVAHVEHVEHVAYVAYQAQAVAYAAQAQQWTSSASNYPSYNWGQGPEVVPATSSNYPSYNWGQGPEVVPAGPVKGASKPAPAKPTKPVDSPIPPRSGNPLSGLKSLIGAGATAFSLLTGTVGSGASSSEGEVNALVSSLTDRAKAIQGSLTGRTVRSTTTAVLRAVTSSGESRVIVATSEQYFRSAWLNALQPGEIAVAGPDHAEINALNAAAIIGLTPVEIAASRPICLGCQLTLGNAAVRMLSALKKYPAFSWLP